MQPTLLLRIPLPTLRLIKRVFPFGTPMIWSYVIEEETERGKKKKEKKILNAFSKIIN